MCGIIGIIADRKLNDNEINNINKLILESSIRGRHATGLAYYDFNDGDIVSYVKNADSNSFCNEYFDSIRANISKLERIRLIAHTRYSTSNIDYNQPIVYDDYATVLNGVITQEPYDKWINIFNIDTNGDKNDASILNRWIRNNSALYNILEHKCSAATINILPDGNVLYFRTHDRPMKTSSIDGVTYIASTHEILRRALGEDITIENTVPYRVYMDNSVIMHEDELGLPLPKDIQI